MIGGEAGIRAESRREPRGGLKTGPRRQTKRSKFGGEAGIRTLGTTLRSYNGLANRRLQPLGHLTATRKLSINEIAVYGRSNVCSMVPEIVPAGVPAGAPATTSPV